MPISPISAATGRTAAYHVGTRRRHLFLFSPVNIYAIYDIFYF